MSHFTPKYYVEFKDNVVTVLADSEEDAERLAITFQLHNDLDTEVLTVSKKRVLKHDRYAPFTHA